MKLKILNIFKKFEESTIKAILIVEYSKVARCKLVFKKNFFLSCILAQWTIAK